MAAPAFSVPTARLADPALREALVRFARRRLPAWEVDDLVQNTLADALASTSVPADEAEFRRWLRGIARHKIADLYRSRRRSQVLEPELTAGSDTGPSAKELVEWIERELPPTENAHATLGWLLREGDGESLDEIAADAALPAPRVRQRVSRLRRHFHSRWLALGAASLVLLVAAGFAFQAWHRSPAPSIARETPESPQREIAPAPVPALPAVMPEVKSPPRRKLTPKRQPIHTQKPKQKQSSKFGAPKSAQETVPAQKASPAAKTLSKKLGIAE